METTCIRSDANNIVFNSLILITHNFSGTPIYENCSPASNEWPRYICPGRDFYLVRRNAAEAACADGLESVVKVNVLEARTAKESALANLAKTVWSLKCL